MRLRIPLIPFRLIVALLMGTSGLLFAAVSAEAQESAYPTASTPVKGQDADSGPGWFSGYTVAPGVSFRSDQILIHKGSDRALFLGEAGDFLEAYHIKVSSPDPHAVGINVETELGQFSAHRQRFSNTTTDAQGNESTAYHTTNIGTRIEGTYAFVVPTLYFRREKPAFVNKWGGGLGLGFIQIDGTARMAPGLEERQADATPTPIHSGQVPGFSALVFVEVTPFFDPAAGLGFLKALRARLELGLVSTFGSRTDYSIDVARLTVSYVFGGS